MNQLKEIKDSQGEPYRELRIGIHTGPLVCFVRSVAPFAFFRPVLNHNYYTGIVTKKVVPIPVSVRN